MLPRSRPTPDPATRPSRVGPAGRLGTWMGSAIRMAEVRLRIPIVLVAATLVASRWDAIRNHWDRLIHPMVGVNTFRLPVSSDTEYFCPMDPGVVSNGPGRCGVCNMALVRRRRGDAVMLPEGVLARMQFTPYRIQLAGIQTAPVGYRPLRREATASGRVARQEKSAAATVEIPMRLAPWIAEGQEVEVSCPDLAGLAPFAGRIRSLARVSSQGIDHAHVTVAIDNPPPALLAGMIAELRFHADVATLDPFLALPREPPRRGPREPGVIYVCHDHPETIAVEAGRCPIDGKNRMSRALGDLERVRWWCPMHPDVQAGEPGRTCQQCGGMRLQPRVVYFAPPGQVLAVPQSAVVDTGARKVVFVESMPGMFDGVEVEVGPRCGDFYPIVRGIEPGQAVAVSGAFLLDAETRLNPTLAAAYFGAARRDRDAGAAQTAEPPAAVRQPKDAASPFTGLGRSDRALAERQKTCPVTGKPLGSMGTPKRVEVSGQVVFLCCKGCEAALRSDPQRYMAKLPDAGRGRP